MARVLIVEHESNAGIGLVGERIAAAGVDMVVVGPEAGGEVPESAAGFDGVVVLGGTPGPTDDDDAVWLPRVRALIADCLAREVPYLGICLGGQMLAVVAGGVVGPVRSGAEVG
ncbi:glutamine amidotransferase-related protein, partial [Agromyces neolithicus]